MSELEVERPYQRRAQWNRDAAELLREHVDADPFGAGSDSPRLFIVARPIAGWPEMCRDLVSGRDVQGKIKTLTGILPLDTSLRAARRRIGVQPHVSITDDLPAVGRTARGAMLSSSLLSSSLEGATPRGTGMFDEWQWWRGSDRVTWRPPGSEVIYKVESCPGTNALEDENMSRWRGEGRAWAPETRLLLCGNVEVLAMPYFADPIDFSADIPEVARQILPDLFIANFRRHADGQVTVIDAGDPSPR